MPFIFTKKFTGDIKPLIATAKKIAAITEAHMSGDEYSGLFSGRTVVGEIIGSYTVTNGVIKIFIHKKPFLVSEAKLVAAFDTYFS